MRQQSVEGSALSEGHQVLNRHLSALRARVWFATHDEAKRVLAIRQSKGVPDRFGSLRLLLIGVNVHDALELAVKVYVGLAAVRQVWPADYGSCPIELDCCLRALLVRGL